MRVTKLSAAALLLAAAALCGWYGAVKADQHSAKVRMVQQTDPGAQQGQQQGVMDQMKGMGGAPSAGGATLPQGITPKELGKAEEVRKTFSSLTQAVLKKDNFKDVTDYYVKGDRDRLSGGGNQNMDAWNKAVDNFDQAWKSKYNSNFDISDRNKAFGDQYLTVQQGMIDDPKAVTHWPVTPMQSMAQAFEKETSNPSLQKGVHIALASLHGAGNEPPLTASLIHEGMSWKIDIPDTVTADDLKASIAHHLDQVVSMKDQWPSDPNDAVRVVTYHILVACYTAGMHGGGASSQGSTMGSQGGSTATPSSSTPSQTGTSGGTMGTTSSQSGGTSEDQDEGTTQEEE